MEIFSAILSFFAAIAWPVAIIIVAFLFRAPIVNLIGHFGGLAKRAATAPFDLEIGKIFKLSIKEAIKETNPSNPEEAAEIAANKATELVSVYDTLRTVSHNEMSLLKQITSTGSKGFTRKGSKLSDAYLSGMADQLVKKGLATRDANGRYFINPAASKLVEDFAAKRGY